jgi:hypothetical protein
LCAPTSSWLTPRITAGKNWSSEKTRVVVSGRISAIERVRWVTRLRAARFGTYPNSATARRTASRIGAATVVEPLTTRETVARDTPARRATSSRVGRLTIRSSLHCSLHDATDDLSSEDHERDQQRHRGQHGPGQY